MGRMTTKPNTVYFVGAGPGDPDLLTLKAHRMLREADEILHDDLVPPAVLALANPAALVASVGKRCGAKTMTQEQINARMIRSAHEGRAVVRLKGGDPGLFGRLAEEIDALEAAGVPYEVIPGVTAGMAAAASLGISLTDRRGSSHAIFVSAHPARRGDAEARPDWRSLAHPDGVLVIYMPGGDLPRLRDELVAAGLDPRTPAALISRASTPEQTVRNTSIEDIGRVLDGLFLLAAIEVQHALGLGTQCAGLVQLFLDLGGAAVEAALHQLPERPAEQAEEDQEPDENPELGIMEQFHQPFSCPTA